MLGLEFKKSPALLVFVIVVLLCVTALVWHKDVTPREASLFLSGALVFPGLFGRKASG